MSVGFINAFLGKIHVQTCCCYEREECYEREFVEPEYHFFWWKV